MCYFLTIATPLTLGEVRSMLPAGLAAHTVPAGDAAALRRLLPAAQTVASLVTGACSCDLVRRRDPSPREDERDLRTRYARLGLPRARIIEELERHRRRPAAAEPAAGWAGALLSFVAEHARNAGPTVYLLRFGAAGALPEPSAGPPVTVTLGEARARPDAWLAEDRPVLLVR